MPWNFWNLLNKLGIKKRTREEESLQNLSHEINRSNPVSLSREGHLRRKYNPRPSSAIESGFHSSSENIPRWYNAPPFTSDKVNNVSKRPDEKATTTKPTLNSTSSGPTTELHKSHTWVIPTWDTEEPSSLPEDRNKFSPLTIRSNSIKQELFRRPSNQPKRPINNRNQGKYRPPCNTAYFSIIDSKRLHEKTIKTRATVNKNRSEPTTKSHEDRSDVLHSLTPTCDTEEPSPPPKDRSNDSSLTIISQLNDPSMFHQDEKRNSKQEHTNLFKGYKDNSDIILTCKSSKQDISCFKEKYKLYNYSNDSKASGKIHREGTSKNSDNCDLLKVSDF